MSHLLGHEILIPKQIGVQHHLRYILFYFYFCKVILSFIFTRLSVSFFEINLFSYNHYSTLTFFHVS